jgi:hypothetical protein
MADDRSADMDERKDPPPEQGSRPPIAATGGLPTAQQAHIDYTAHVTGEGRAHRCQRCSDVDRMRCSEGERLWQAWNRALNDAYEQLHHGAP